MPSKKISSFQCEFCDKVYLPSCGLKSHVTKKQPSSKVQDTSSANCLGLDLVPAAQMNLKVLILKSFFERSICKLPQDECYRWARESCEDCHCFDLSLFPQSRDKDHNH